MRCRSGSIDLQGPAPVHSATEYAAWLRGRGALRAEFDQRMGVVQTDATAYRDKAAEWPIGYGARMHELRQR